MSVLSSTNPIALAERLRDAGTVTPALIADVIGASVRQFSPPWQAVRSKRVGQLIRLGAWTDAVLELIELELPRWKMRRLVYDEGEWYCALSRQRELPDWLDQAVEGHHPDLALALLTALTEARRLASDEEATRVPCAPQGANQGANTVFEPMLSDNFA